jgi:hypothetical protein
MGNGFNLHVKDDTGKTPIRHAIPGIDSCESGELRAASAC